MKTELFCFLKERMNRYPDTNISDTAGMTWSYKEFLHSAEAFAEQLTCHKYGICCRSEFWSALAVMACIRAGVTAVPISTEYGEAQKKRIVDICGLSRILTDTRGYLTEEIVGPTVWEPEDLSDVAFMMCTSGTTGLPKAAMLTGRNILANLSDIEKYFPLSHRDRILINRSLCHVSVLAGEFLTALSNGTSIVFDETRFDPVRTLLQTKAHGITVLCGTPTFFHHFCHFALRHPEYLMLRIIAVSGECMTEKTALFIREALPKVSVYHVYGLTEASPRVAWLPPEYFNIKPLSVGIPLVSETVKITDENGASLLPGTVGELWVRGPNVMKGYYNNQEATNAAIQNNWLRTGDTAYLDNDNHLFICGRRDDLIIRAGLNIYPAEIENQLLEEDYVDEVVVRGLEAEVGQKLICYVVLNDDQMTAEAIFTKIKKKLPPQHWPDEIVITQDLPKSISGKKKRCY